MIVNDSNAKTSKYVPMWNSNGQKVINAIALDASTAKYTGELVPTSSGWGFWSVASLAATGGLKFGVALESASSGEYIDVAVAGYVSGVNQGDTGDTAALSTYVAGDGVVYTDTGHLVAYGATYAPAALSFSTAQTTAAAVVGVAISSGETTSVDLLIVEKPYIHPTAT